MAVTRQIRLLAVLAVLALAAAACGLKPEVQQRIELRGQGAQNQFAAGAGAGDTGFGDLDGDGFEDGSAVAAEDGFADGGTGDDGFDDGSGTTAGGFSTTTGGTTAGGGTTGGSTTGGSTTGGSTTGGGTTGGGTTGGGTTGGGTTGGGTGGSGGGSGSTGGGTTQSSGSGDSTGVSGDTVKIGVHAPITGAAPIPVASFEEGNRRYWEVRGAVHGRHVEVIFRDDQYNPSTATRVCNEMIQGEQVFFLVGAGGTDQIAACARVAAQQGVPYLSAGVTEGPLRPLPNYFAFSMSYAQQAPLLVQWIQRNAPPSNGRIGVIRTDTPNFDDGINAFIRAAQDAGYDTVERKLSKDPSSAEKAQACQFLLQNQIEVAYPLMAPADWVEVAKNATCRGIQWAGVGITMGLNTVAAVGCPDIEGAMFFSPFPGLNTADQLDPEFNATGGGDDIVWALWSSSRILDRMLTLSGRELTRERLIQVITSNVIETPAYPVQRHTPDDHFGVNQVHVLRADCSQRPGRYVTPSDGLFRSQF